MDKKFEGTFSLGFYSLQLQLQHLLEECGGEAAVQLLDTLSNVPAAQRQTLVQSLIQVASRFASAEAPHLDSAAMNALEERLYKDIVAHLSQANVNDSRKLEVLSGGKDKKFVLPDRTPISLEEARKAKRSSLKPCLN